MKYAAKNNTETVQVLNGAKAVRPGDTVEVDYRTAFDLWRSAEKDRAAGRRPEWLVKDPRPKATKPATKPEKE